MLIHCLRPKSKECCAGLPATPHSRSKSAGLQSAGLQCQLCACRQRTSKNDREAALARTKSENREAQNRALTTLLSRSELKKPRGVLRKLKRQSIPWMPGTDKAVPLGSARHPSVYEPIFLIPTRCRPDHSFSESRGQHRPSCYLRHGQPRGSPPF